MGSESLERLLVLLGLCFFLHEPTGDTNRPFQKGERNRCVEGEPQGCGESRKGPRMALVRRPSERRWSERTPAQPGPNGGARPFGSFWGDCQKGLAQQGETGRSGNSPIVYESKTFITSQPNPTLTTPY